MYYCVWEVFINSKRQIPCYR